MMARGIGEAFAVSFLVVIRNEELARGGDAVPLGRCPWHALTLGRFKVCVYRSDVSPPLRACSSPRLVFATGERVLAVNRVVGKYCRFEPIVADQAVSICLREVLVESVSALTGYGLKLRF
jgi:hypothetical protein